MSSGRKCKNCGSSDIEVDPARGDAVCTNCGSVLEDSIIVAEVQFEEGAHGSSSAIGQFVSADSKGGATKFGASFHVGVGVESREFTLRKARNGITNLCNQLRLNQHCIDTACSFFKMALSRNLTRGRRNTHVHAACVYLTCRTEGTAHLLIDISDVLQICCYELGRTYLKLSQALCINIPAVDPCLYILRFAAKLQFGSKTQQVANTALRLVQRMKRDSIHSGRRPSGLCGAALLIASRLHEFNRSAGDIVKIVKVHESTLRKRLIEFGDTPSSALTLEEFMTVDLEEEQDPPSFKAARKKDKERLQKLMEEEADSITDLQRQIEIQLEKDSAKKRQPKLSKDGFQEVHDTNKFINESTLGTIHKIIQEEQVDSPDVEPVRGLGPDIASMGLANSLDDTSNAFQPSTAFEVDLTFDDIDDAELDTYIMTDHEFECKKGLWHQRNAAYLEEQKDMGGCRCSYKNCENTTKNTENVHFFHYPVKQKERCKIWVDNANKPQFFYLEEGQLRNKVICQYHFEDRWFPNCLKKRLLQGAVPTLDAGCGDDFVPQEAPLYLSSQLQDVQMVPANADGTIFVLDTDTMFSRSQKIESYFYKNGAIIPANSEHAKSTYIPSKPSTSTSSNTAFEDNDYEPMQNTSGVYEEQQLVDALEEAPLYLSSQLQDAQVLSANADGTIFVLNTDAMFSKSQRIESYIYKNDVIVPVNSKQAKSTLSPSKPSTSTSSNTSYSSFKNDGCESIHNTSGVYEEQQSVDALEEAPLYLSSQLQDVQVLPANADGTIIVLDTNTIFINSQKIESYIYKNGVIVKANSKEAQSTLTSSEPSSNTTYSSFKNDGCEPIQNISGIHEEQSVEAPEETPEYKVIIEYGEALSKPTMQLNASSKIDLERIRVYLVACEDKEETFKAEKLKKEREEGKPEKKRKRATRKKAMGPTNSAGEAIEKILQEKKISSKINYDVLKSLNAAPVKNEPVPVEDEAAPTTSESIKRRRLSSVSNYLEQTPAKGAGRKAKTLVDVGLPFFDDSPKEVPKEQRVLKEEAKKEGPVPAISEEELEEDYEEEEQPPEESTNEMGVLQMLRQHREDDEGEDFGYDYFEEEY